MTQNFDPATIIDDGKPLFMDTENPAGVEPVVETPPEETPPEDEAQYLIQLDRRQLDAQLKELLANDPEARNIFNREVGNKAAARYKPEIAKRDQDLATYRMLLRREQFAKLSQEEINTRFNSDPNFARAYAEVQHFNAAEPAPAEAISEADQAAMVGAIDVVVRNGLARGLTQDDLNEIAQGLQSNKYDIDETGAPIPVSQWREAVGNLQQDIEERIRKNSTPTPVETPTSTENPAPTPAPHADTARPDMAPSGNRGTYTNSITMAQFKAMPWEQQFKYLTEPDGSNISVDEAVDRGKITVEGL